MSQTISKKDLDAASAVLDCAVPIHKALYFTAKNRMQGQTHTFAKDEARNLEQFAKALAAMGIVITITNPADEA